MSHVFDGRAYAKQKEEAIKKRVDSLRAQSIIPHVKTFTFSDDEGSRLYTKLKKTVAETVGIVYEPVVHTLSDDISLLVEEIRNASVDPAITGVMIQKPTKEVWGRVFDPDAHPFRVWWDGLVSAIDPHKDVDCLTKENLVRIKEGDPFVIPATVRAALSILDEAKKALAIDAHRFKQQSVAIIGKSDIVGKPLYWMLQKEHKTVDLFGRANMPKDFRMYDIVISAVGRENLVTGQILKKGSIVIDVGSPKGDVEFSSAVEVTSFLTPVPGGVGPVTVVSLMENCLPMSENCLVFPNVVNCCLIYADRIGDNK